MILGSIDVVQAWLFHDVASKTEETEVETVL